MTDSEKAQHIAAAVRAHEAAERAHEAATAAVNTRRVAVVAARESGASWGELAAELGVSRPRVVDMARDVAVRNARRKKVEQ